MYAFTLDDSHGDTPLLRTAHAPAEPWNGFAVPVATADEIRAYVAAAVANDRHHVWTGEVSEGHFVIIVRRHDAEDGHDMWKRQEDGTFHLDGFVWEQVSQ